MGRRSHLVPGVRGLYVRRANWPSFLRGAEGGLNATEAVAVEAMAVLPFAGVSTAVAYERALFRHRSSELGCRNDCCHSRGCSILPVCVWMEEHESSIARRAEIVVVGIIQVVQFPKSSPRPERRTLSEVPA